MQYPPNPADEMGPPDFNTQGMQPIGQGAVDPAMIKYLLENYGDVLAGENVNDEIAQARALRDTQMPGMVRGGRGMTAASGLGSAAGALMKQYAGIRDEKKAMGERDAITQRIGDRVGKFGENILAPGAQGAAQTDPTLDEFGLPKRNIPAAKPRY